MEPPERWYVDTTASTDIQPEPVDKVTLTMHTAAWMLLTATWVLVFVGMLTVMVFLIQDTPPATTQELVMTVVEESAKSFFPWLSLVPLAGATLNIIAFTRGDKNPVNLWVLVGNGFTWSTLMYLQTLL